MSDEDTLEGKLRLAASKCTKPKYKALLTDTADNLRIAVKHVAKMANADNMIALNGAWVKAVRVLALTPTEAGPPSPLAEAQRIAA